MSEYLGYKNISKWRHQSDQNQDSLKAKVDKFLEIFWSLIFLKMPETKRKILKSYEICSKLTIKTPERRQWRLFGISIVIFEHISHLFTLALLLILNS